MREDNNIKARLIAMIPRQEMDFIDRIGKDALYSTGHKLTRTAVINAVLRVMETLSLSGANIHSEDELREYILNAIGRKTEKRRYPRLNKKFDIAFRKAESMKDHNKAATVDVGLGGFKMETECINESLGVGKIIEMTIEDPEADVEEINAFGRVAWIRQKQDGPGFEVGIALTYMKKEDQARFAAYLNESTPEKKESEDINRRNRNNI